MYYLIRSLLHNRRGKVALSAKLPIRNTTELAIRNSFFLIYVKYLSEGLESDSKHFLIQTDVNLFVFDFKMHIYICYNN